MFHVSVIGLTFPPDTLCKLKFDFKLPLKAETLPNVLDCPLWTHLGYSLHPPISEQTLREEKRKI